MQHETTAADAPDPRDVKPAGPAEAPAPPDHRSGVEGKLVSTGESLESAAKDLGHKLDEKLLNNEAGREAKRKVGGLWGKIKETIK